MAVQLDYACVGNCSSTSTHDTRICTEEHVHMFQLHFFPFEWQYKHYACVGNCSSTSTHDTRICTEEHEKNYTCFNYTSFLLNGSTIINAQRANVTGSMI